MSTNYIISQIEALNEWEELMEQAKAEAEAIKDALNEYYGAAEPPVRWWRSHLSGLSEPPRLTTGYFAFSGSNP